MNLKFGISDLWIYIDSRGWVSTLVPQKMKFISILIFVYIRGR